MSAQIAAYGRLGRDAEVLQTKKGNDMVKASIAVLVGRGPQDKPMWLDILAFGEAGDELAQCRKGDGLTVFGKLQGQEWQGKMSLTCMADTIVTGHRQGGGGGEQPPAPPPTRQPSRPAPAPAPPPPDDLDDDLDDIPFRTRLGDNVRDVLGDAGWSLEEMFGRWVREARSFTRVLLGVLRTQVPVRGTQADTAGNAPSPQAG